MINRIHTAQRGSIVMTTPQTSLLTELNLIRRAAGRKPLERLVESESLREDLELDSLDLAELTVRLQAKFGVDVFAKRNLRTVGDVVEELGG